MPRESHSFIDVAALDAVREHFAAGDAIVILSTALDEVIWTNGPGAQLLGFAGIEAAIGDDPGLGRAARRQIEATPGYPRIGVDRPISVRLAAGMISQTVVFHGSFLELADDGAVMLTVPLAHSQARAAEDVAKRAISGLEERGNYLAIVRQAGDVIAATPGFDALGLGAGALRQAISEVGANGQRVVKKIVRVSGRATPIGMARLTADPPSYLLIAVDDGAAAHATEVADAAERPDVASSPQAADAGQPAAMETEPTPALADTNVAHAATERTIAETQEETSSVHDELREQPEPASVVTDAAGETRPVVEPTPAFGEQASTEDAPRNAEPAAIDVDDAVGSGQTEPVNDQIERTDNAEPVAEIALPPHDMPDLPVERVVEPAILAISDDIERPALAADQAADGAGTGAEWAEPDMASSVATPDESLSPAAEETAPETEPAAIGTEPAAERRDTNGPTGTDASVDTSDAVASNDEPIGDEPAIEQAIVQQTDLDDAASPEPLVASAGVSENDAATSGPVGSGHVGSGPVGSGAEADRAILDPVATDQPIMDQAAAPTTEETMARREPHAAEIRDGEQPPASTHVDEAPVRFVWHTDAEARFSSVSPEFFAATGLQPSRVIGHRFADLAKLFRFDPNGEIASLLEKRDTWSGRTLLWPSLDGASEFPIDLAALPTYGRDRMFSGFRGFGVVRVADRIRRAATPPAAETEAPASRATAKRDDKADAAKDDPFRGEPPALAAAENAPRPFGKKVIRLDEHRAPTTDRTLSPTERNTFREIGEQLKRTSDDEPARPADRATVAPGHNGKIEADGRTGVPQEDVGPSIGATSESAFIAGLERPVSAADASARHEADTARPDETVGRLRSDGAMQASIAAGSTEAEIGLSGGDDAATTPAEAEAVRDDASTSPRSAMHDAGDSGAARIETRSATSHDHAMPSAERPKSLLDFANGDEAATSPPSEIAPAPKVEVSIARSSAPPLKQSGFTPSAFAERVEPRVDTSILSQLPIPVLVHAGDALHYANAAFLDLTGYDSVEQLARMGGLGVLLSGPVANRRDDDNRVLMTTRGGETVPVSAFLQSVPWLGGKALLLTLTRQPATAVPAPAIAQPDPLLKERVEELRTILDTATDGVVLMDKAGIVRSISRPAEALFGCDSDAVVGKPFISLFAIESQRAAADYLAGLAGNGVASVLNDGREVIGREAKGRFIPLFMTIGRLPGDGGFCAVLRDITHWKRAEEDLTQARAQAERTSSQKSDFLARVSHEIRTPLNAIIGFSELMLDEKFGPVANDRYRDYLRDINRSGNHVLDLVNDLLDISKIEAGQQDMQYEAVALNDALAETVAMMQPQANRERVIIRSSFASKLPEVVADQRSVRQIALNILSNAVRYTQAGGQVIVSTSYESNGEVVMRVRDTGIGMTQTEIEQALKPFKQINSLNRPRGDGTGLGLPLTKAMVEANRAKFSIYSTPGEGTMVEVTFPATRVLAE